MIRRVLFLGAGASFRAAYPLGRDLIRAVEEFLATVELDEGRKAYWSRFLACRDTAEGMAKLLLSSGNPEVVLSYLDLCAEALSADDAAIRVVERDAVHDFRNFGDADVASAFTQERGEHIESLYDDLKRAPLHSAIRARHGFVAGLDAYLGYMHYRDNEPEGFARRKYLHSELASLSAGDLVITTNYDTLAERVLLETRRWSAVDGYGFSVPLTNIPPEALRPRLAPAAWAVEPSAVKVLKLHGSFGWRHIEGVPDLDAQQVVLGSELLQAMLPMRHGKISLLYDLREKQAPFPMTHPAMIYPSFLKQTSGVSFLEVWEAARLALANAEEIRILGASLPPADIGVRTLFAPVRFRLERHEVVVQVDDKSEESYERWAALLGRAVRWERRFAGE